MTNTERPELEQRLRAAFPFLTDADFDYHATDLYVRYTPELREWLRRNYTYHKNTSLFTSQIDGQRWMDIPFAGHWPRRS